MARTSLPEWEAELWAHLSRGDGMRCPLLDRCRSRAETLRCADSNLEEIRRLLGSDDGFDPADYGETGHCGDGVLPLVERLAQSHIEKGGASRRPVPTELVALADESQPIEVRVLPLQACDAATWRLRDGWVIQLNETTSRRRRRVSLFHEAFHIMAHSRSRTAPAFSTRGVTRGSFNELMADHFALCVLMPRDWVEEEWPSAADADKMAEAFQVPISAMWLRLCQLGLAD